MLPKSAERVASSTEECINEQIRRETEKRVKLYASCGREMIDERLDELDREWDIERVLETNASGLTLLGVIMSIVKRRAWIAVSGIVAGFLFQHGMQGWCPPLPILRRLGFRTRDEIDTERYALKAARGDFENISKNDSVEELMVAVRK
jgi:hypothetical protein